MSGSLAIRSYSLQQNTHAHPFPQIVIPLAGAMGITIGGERFSVGVGHCIIIPEGTEHRYSAPERSRFLVADMGSLPVNAESLKEPCVAIGSSLMAFCSYAEVQLTSSSDEVTGTLLFDLFQRLLEQQDFAARIDPRIMRAIQRMEEDLAQPHSIESLADAAHLSVSQFKSLFKKHLDVSATEHLTKLRMEKARTLLRNTDYPISVVAADVGYDDASAFSRRFRSFFGQSPSEFTRRS